MTARQVPFSTPGQLRHDYATPIEYPELPYNRAARVIANAFEGSEIIPYADKRLGTTEWCPIQSACSEAIGNDERGESLLADVLKIDHPAVKRLLAMSRDYWIRQHATELAELLD